ncbi:MAG: hypothetical protein RLY40_444 [Pseudomonadota bacterium]|jgi:hypothetical protein
MRQFDELIPPNSASKDFTSPNHYYLTIQFNAEKAAKGLLERCLPTTWSAPDDCKISWDDVEEFYLEGHATCDVEKIVIDSESFLFKLKFKDKAVQNQWLQFAAAVSVSGNAVAASKVANLIECEKLFSLLPYYKEYITNRSEQLKNIALIPAILDDSIAHSLFSSLQINRTAFFSFDTTLFDINTISLQKSNLSTPGQAYDLNIDFLSKEIRVLLNKWQSLSLYKNSFVTKTIFIPKLKLNVNLTAQEISWLNFILDRSRFSHLIEKYPDIFNQCQLQCFNINFSDRTLLRSVLIALINPTNFKKPIVNFGGNLTGFLFNQSVLKFITSELWIDENDNFVAEMIGNKSIIASLASYASLAQRLKLSFRISLPSTQEVIIIDQTQALQARNDLNFASHIIGSEKIIISGGLNLTHLPLPAVTIHQSNKLKCLDFQILALQIKENFNASLLHKLSVSGRDVIIDGFFQYKNNISVIRVILKNSLLNRGYQQLDIIPNFQRTKIINAGTTLHLQPLPYHIPANKDNINFLNIKKLEGNTSIFIPTKLGKHDFFRIKHDLIVSDVLSSSIQGKKPYFLVLQNYYREPAKAITHTLEFIEQTIHLLDQQVDILQAPDDWDAALNEFKETLYTEAFQAGKMRSRIVKQSTCYQQDTFSMDDRFRREAVNDSLLEESFNRSINDKQKIINLSKGSIKQNLVLVNATSNMDEVDWLIDTKKPIYHLSTEIILTLPMSAWMGGLLSANLERIGERYQPFCPSLPAYMQYGFKPFLSALMSSGYQYFRIEHALDIDESFARLLTYFMLNFLGVIVGQPLTKTLAATIQNKLISFLIQALTWTLLWNPSLFTSDYLEIIPMIGMQLLQGLFFKLGEETLTLAKKSYDFSASFWHKPELKVLSQEPISQNGMKFMRI